MWDFIIKKYVWIGILCALIIIWCILAPVVLYNKGYKTGQIDAINGKVHFELQNSQQWILKDK